MNILDRVDIFYQYLLSLEDPLIALIAATELLDKTDLLTEV